MIQIDKYIFTNFRFSTKGKIWFIIQNAITDSTLHQTYYTYGRQIDYAAVIFYCDTKIAIITIKIFEYMHQISLLHSIDDREKTITKTSLPFHLHNYCTFACVKSIENLETP